MTTPNAVYTSIVCAIFTVGCGPELSAGWDDDTDAAEDTPTDIPGECEPPAAMVVECDTAAICWTWFGGWSSWAQYAEPTGIIAAINDGVLIPTSDVELEAACFDVLGTDHHVCVIEVDCIGLMGRPSVELALTPSDCAIKGPWSSIGETVGGCWGVVDGVAVLLDPEH